MKHAFAAALAMLVAVFAMPAVAQNWSLNPNYGSYNINSGFVPDPWQITVQAGGNINVGNNISGCRGYITNQPDVRIYYQAGSFSTLSFYVRSNADTTLVINAPNAQWYCNDDFQGLNPGVTFNGPMTGQYDIWVGAYNRSSTGAGATLYVSELGAF